MNDVAPQNTSREPDEVPGRLIAIVCGAAITLAIVLGTGATFIVRSHLGPRVPVQGPRTSELPEPGTARQLLLPVHVAVPPLREQAEHAQRWGWTDRNAETFHMPLDVAAELWLEQREAKRK